MRIIKNEKTGEGRDIKEMHMKYDGTIVIINLEEITKLRKDLVAAKDNVEALNVEVEKLKSENAKLRGIAQKTHKLYLELQEKYSKFTKYQNRKGFNKEYALACYKLMRENQDMSIRNISDILQEYFALGYETARLYVKAIREGRMYPVRLPSGEVEMQGILLP